MHETVILILKICGIYLVGMAIPYLIAAKVIGYDNMVSEQQETFNWIIALSWIGIAVTIILGIVVSLKMLLDFLFKIKS